ncbi:MAG: carbamoyltransferase HypF [Nanobdellota archaeon]
MYRILVKGTVQGVGFRPFVYREAKKIGAKGEVKNAGYGVEIICDKKEEIINSLKTPPPLANIDSIHSEKINLDKKNYEGFEIKKSEKTQGETILPPDVFTCEKCLKELRNKKNRRYGYFFITCTDCGPRYSMIEDYPYDRPYTSMKDFQMCQACRKEYTNPMDRRYHAQTIACKDCGPKLSLTDNKGNILEKKEKQAIKKSAELIKKGEIVSIKGVGGFHLATTCKPENVTKLRKLLKRKDKPFAIMVKNRDMLKRIANPNNNELQILNSPQRPIVVVEKKNNNKLKEVSELESLGVMLPYTALHYLLFDFLDEPIVMTSANMPGEPVLIEEGIAPYNLTHNRRIVNRCDDSIKKVIANKTITLRRSRGYVPTPIRLPIKCKETLALGALTSNTIAITKGNNAFLSQHIGNCSKPKTIEFMNEAIKKMISFTKSSPEIIAVDKHPEYETRRYAKFLAEKFNAKVVPIQHHKAHLASCAGELNINDYTGISSDGLGYGENGELWGGEIFKVKNISNFKRIGKLEEQPMIGGDSSTINPKKMLFGILSKFMDKNKIYRLGIYTDKEIKIYSKMLESGFNTPLTTSTGRVLDAAAAFLGFCDKATYEGRPAMLLESKAIKGNEPEPIIEEKEGIKILMTTPIFKHIAENHRDCKEKLAWIVHQYIAKGLYKIARENSEKIVISGGVFQNKIIGQYLINKKAEMSQKIPLNDGGICYGQCILANK